MSAESRTTGTERANPYIHAKVDGLYNKIIADLDIALQNPNELMPQFVKDINEFFEAILEQRLKANNAYFYAGPEIEQWIADNALTYFSPEYLTKDEKDKLSTNTDKRKSKQSIVEDPDSDNAKLVLKEKHIQAGAAKWEARSGNLSLVQRLGLLQEVKNYLALARRLGKTTIEMDFSSTLLFGLNQAIKISCDGREMTVPTNMYSFRLLVDLVANKHLEKALKTADEQGIEKFDQLFIPINDRNIIRDDDFNTQYRLLSHQVDALFKENFEPKDSAQSSSISNANATVDEDKFSKYKKTNQQFLADQIRIFVNTCISLSKSLHLSLLRAALPIDFLIMYFPSNYLTQAENIKTRDNLLEKVKIGVSKFNELQPEQMCCLAKDVCKVAISQLESHGFSNVSIIPNQDNMEKIFFAWTESIQIKVEVSIGNGQTKSQTIKFETEQLHQFAKKVKDESLGKYVQDKIDENLRAASRATSTINASPAVGSRPGSSLGNPSSAVAGNSSSNITSRSVSPLPSQNPVKKISPVTSKSDLTKEGVDITAGERAAQDGKAPPSEVDNPNNSLNVS